MTELIPPQALYLVESTTVAFVSTIGPHGEPQTTPLWFVWDNGIVRFSLVEGRQKLRNLRRDPRLSVTIVDPSDPTWYLELRGRIDDLRPDPNLDLERRIAHKYRGVHVDGEPPGAARYATGVVVHRVTMQLGH